MTVCVEVLVIILRESGGQRWPGWFLGTALSPSFSAWSLEPLLGMWQNNARQAGTTVTV